MMGFLGALAEERERTIVLHGRPGSGKTHLVGTALEGNDDRMILFDFLAGVNTIRKWAGVKCKKTGKPRVVVAKGIQRYDDLWNELVKLEKPAIEGAFQWLVVDNITDGGNVLMNDIRNSLLFGEGGKAVTSPSGRPDVSDFGFFSYRIRNLLARLKVMAGPPYNLNVVMTAWSRVAKGTRSYLVPSSEMESSSNEITGWANYVFHIKSFGTSDNDIEGDAENAGSSRHILYTKQNDSFEAKDRSGVLDAAIENPKFGPIIKKITEVGL